MVASICTRPQRTEIERAQPIIKRHEMNAVLKEISTSNPVTQFLATPKKLLINGKWVAAASGKTFEVTNPAPGRVIARVAEGGEADVDAAVRAARRAFESSPWASMTPSDRGKIIWRIGDLVTKYQDELAELESLGNGKTTSGGD